MSMTSEALPDLFPERHIQIDEEGYFHMRGERVNDAAFGLELMKSLRVDERGRVFTKSQGQWVGVESFDAPLVARQVQELKPGLWKADFPYGFSVEFSAESLSYDEWDRFHAVSLGGVPLIFSRAAQMEFFDKLDSFDDDSFTLGGKTYQLKEWLVDFPDADKESFWTNIYRNEIPGWELGQETPILPTVLPQLKIPKSRILVLGAGTGNDAAYFANQGHIVTAVDFSAEAIALAQSKYGKLDSLSFVQANVFQLPANWAGRFDIIFEHTLYCAVRPKRRTELMKIWKKLLAPGGHLLGVFFCIEKRTGPPYGGSEWELKRRLSPQFDFLYWTRWQKSTEKRQGMEIVIYARAK